MKRIGLVLAMTAVIVGVAGTASADAPTRERELTCSEGTTFTGEQVRQGRGRPPHVWRQVSPGGDPRAFSYHAVTVTAPDGSVVETETWDNSQGVERNHEVVTCSFTIPIGPFTGHLAEFEGFFVPPSGSEAG